MRMYTVINIKGVKHNVTAETIWHAISKAVALDSGKYKTSSYKVFEKWI